jgi:hypothetical protein
MRALPGAARVAQQQRCVRRRVCVLDVRARSHACRARRSPDAPRVCARSTGRAARRPLRGCRALASPPLPPSPPRRVLAAPRRASSRRAVAARAAAGDTPPLPGPRICVLGGGFGGLYTALRLDALPWPGGAGGAPQVTLVDKGERFLFKPLMYELLSGEMDAQEARARGARAARGKALFCGHERNRRVCAPSLTRARVRAVAAAQVAPRFEELLAPTRVRCASRRSRHA